MIGQFGLGMWPYITVVSPWWFETSWGLLNEIDLIHEYQNVPAPYLTILHSKICTFLNGALWDMEQSVVCRQFRVDYVSYGWQRGIARRHFRDVTMLWNKTQNIKLIWNISTFLILDVTGSNENCVVTCYGVPDTQWPRTYGAVLPWVCGGPYRVTIQFHKKIPV